MVYESARGRKFTIIRFMSTMWTVLMIWIVSECLSQYVAGSIAVFV